MAFIIFWIPDLFVGSWEPAARSAEDRKASTISAPAQEAAASLHLPCCCTVRWYSQLLILTPLAFSSEQIALSLSAAQSWIQSELLLTNVPGVRNPLRNCTQNRVNEIMKKELSGNETPQLKSKVWFIWMVSLNKSTKVTNWSTRRNLTRSATPRVSAKCTINGCGETPKVWIQFVCFF